MRKFKYIILALLLISLSISSFPHILNGFSSGPSADLKFLEAYTYAEITAKLDPGDSFFDLIQTGKATPTGSKLGFCPESKMEIAWEYIHTPAFKEQLPANVLFAWGPNQADPGTSLFALKKMDSPYKGPSQSDIKSVEISGGNLLISFTEEGSAKWAKLTGNSVGNSVAIVINDMVYSAPVVRELIKNGKCAISGNFSENDLIELKAALEQ